jgi:hypothetical protein
LRRRDSESDQASDVPGRRGRRGFPELAAATLWLVLAGGCFNARRAVPPELAATLGAAPIAAAYSAPRGPAAALWPAPDLPSRQQLAEYRADRPKSVVDLQQFRELTRLTLDGFEGGPAQASLIDLNPHVRTWYLLRLEGPKGASTTFHLENPSGARLRLDPAHPSGIVIEREGGPPADGFLCELWPAGKTAPLVAARRSAIAYAPLCGGRLYLRNAVEGHRTPKEAVVDLLRDHVWQGEEITVLVRDLFFKDAYLATSNLVRAPMKPPAESPSGPASPLVSAAAVDRLLVPVDLEIGLDGESGGQVAVGRWYPAQDNPGIFVTTIRPDVVAPEVIEAQKGSVNPLDPVESAALVYLVAFDLGQFDLGFRLGTDHPRVGWSDMVPPAARDDALTGPDGIETISPLVRTGMLSPAEAGRVAATFTGGFKRAHGAFRMSDLATIDHGSHYGFIENGVVLSKLQRGLATVLVFDDGRVDLVTWTEANEALLPRIRHARQNGVAILEPAPGSRRTVPGSRVRDWGAGNWSGSADRKLRTLRAGLCLQESQGKAFLVYGYFSSATPSSMARVFQASGCRYAMLLDMNALEHTYMAVYRTQGSRRVTEHLIDGMGVVDGSRDGQPLPRFVSVADNRDFFYLLRHRPR